MDVKVQSVSHNRGDLRLLRNVGFEVKTSETVVISGSSGDGKSLLFSIICGLAQPDKGQVLFNGANIFTMTKAQNQILRKHFNAIFQRPALISNLTLRENFLLPLNLHYPLMTMDTKLEKIAELAELLGLTQFLEQRTSILSAGQLSLASVLRGVLLKPKCLIWDAPLIEIDQRYENVVKSLLHDLKQAGSTMILLSNRQDLIDEFANRHFVLSEGILRQHDVK